MLILGLFFKPVIFFVNGKGSPVAFCSLGTAVLIRQNFCRSQPIAHLLDITLLAQTSADHIPIQQLSQLGEQHCITRVSNQLMCTSPGLHD